MLAFIQNNLSLTNVRFLSYYKGRKDEDKLREIFNNSVITQLFLGIVLCVTLYSLTGIIFNHFLNIESERISEAKMVYYFMLGSLFFNFISVPFLSILISRENILYSSIVQIFDAVLKIPVALSLIWISTNKLEWYACWTALIIVLNFILYFSYCTIKFAECKHFSLNKFNINLLKEMFTFMGWNIYGTLCIVGRQQGIAILLNRFYSTVINAAYGIAFQVAAQLNFVANSLTTAINPQIIKAEGMGDRTKMFRLSEISCKFSFLLMSMISIPTYFYMPTILEAWLINVPEYTTMFCRYVLIGIQIDLLSLNLNTANQAIGNVKYYQICLQTIKILTLPFAWLALHYGYSARVVMIIYVSFEAICSIARVLFLHYNVKLSISNYLTRVFLKVLFPFIINISVCTLLSTHLKDWYMLITFFISITITATTIYVFGLTPDEKILVNNILIKLRLKGLKI